MSDLITSKVSTSGTQSHVVALMGNVEQEPPLLNSNPAPINRTPFTSSTTPVNSERKLLTPNEQRLEIAQKLAEFCQADISSTTKALDTIYLLIAQAELFSRQVCELSKRAARWPTSEAFRTDPKSAVKDLREGWHACNAARDKLDLVVHELAKLMATLESRTKDAADSKRLDDMTRRIQSWGDKVGSSKYMHASTLYERKRQALQAQTP